MRSHRWRTRCQIFANSRLPCRLNSKQDEEYRLLHLHIIKWKMAALERTLPLERSSVRSAHKLIKPYIHLTPVLTSTTLSNLASTPQAPEALTGTPYEGRTPAKPQIKFFFKCENFQRIGAFKARGAFHALLRLSEEERARGVVTTSSGGTQRIPPM